MDTHRRPSARILPGLCRLAVGALLAAGPAFPQVEVWRVGQGGSSWDSAAQTQVGAVSVGGALQPLEIAPGENLIQSLAKFGQQWQNGPPSDYTQGGLPHTWTNSNYFDGLKGPLTLVDGQDTTSTGSVFKSSGNPQGTAFFWDLGAAYPVNRLRFYPRPDDPYSYMRAFEVLVSDGASFDKSHFPVYESLRRVENNDEQVVEVEFPTLSVRFIQLKNLSKTPFNLAEFQLYGDGFIPVSSYLSALHLFDRPADFGTLGVEATRLSRTTAKPVVAPTCVVQVRSGADDTPLNYFRRDRETGDEVEVSPAEYENQLPRLAFFRRDPVTHAVLEEVSKDAYLKLPVDEQGPLRDFVQGAIRVDGENWSPWSVPIDIDSTGSYAVELDLPSPRAYLQFRVLFAGDPDNAIRLNSFRLEHAPELTSGAVGEVALAADPAPAGSVVEVPSGVDTLFTFDIRASFTENGLEGFGGVRVGAFPRPVFVGLEMGQPLTRVTDVTVDSTADGFEVHFAPLNRQNNQPLRITFRQRALESNTPVNAWLLGLRAGLPQPVVAGNANDAVTTNALAIYTLDPAPALQAALSSGILTPNGDGVNDVVEVSCVLIQFAGQIQLRIEVFDLAGRRVRQLLSGPLGSGAYSALWDGRDDAGALVAPGNYVCRIKGEAQAQTFATARVVGVAY